MALALHGASAQPLLLLPAPRVAAPWRGRGGLACAAFAVAKGCRARRQRAAARRCLSQSRTPQEELPRVLMRDEEARKKVACHYLSDLLRLQELPSGEVGLVAAKPIPAGELLIAESQVGDFSLTGSGEKRGFMPDCLAPRSRKQLPERYLGVFPLRELPSAFWATSLGLWLTDYLRFSTNAFSSGLIVVGSFVNHSCIPNARHASRTVEREGRAFSVDIHYAGRAISAGEEVVTCYAEELLETPGWLRRPLLQVSMGFSCDCRRCRQSEQGIEEEPLKPWEVTASQLDELLSRAAAMAPAEAPAMHPCGGYFLFTALLALVPLAALLTGALLLILGKR